MKRVAILGSTGSIGGSALSVVEAHPDRLRIVALAAGGNAERLAQQVARHRPQVVGVATAAARDELSQRLSPDLRPGGIHLGLDGLIAVATHPDADVVLCASAGSAALEAVLAAIEAGKTIALANKEVLVMAGALMMDAATRRGVAILPVDSEHNAIHQCLHGHAHADVRRLILTASGGPFRQHSAADLATVTPDDALRHPTWSMGRKITIDSATLMNKGLEVIEARWLFGMPPAAIDVIVHPQSIVHSMVEFCDGSVIAQLSVTDMRLPIQYAFSYPERWDGPLQRLDFTRLASLEFAPPDRQRFPCLDLAYRAIEHGGVWPIALNAANEVAVEAFLERRLDFPAIPRVIERILQDADSRAAPPRSLREVREIDHQSRAHAGEAIRHLVPSA